MTEYRTSAEEQAQDAQDVHVRLVLDRAVQDAVSCNVAMMLGEPPEVVDRWVDTVWDNARCGLVDGYQAAGLRMDDRLRAVFMLLQPQIDAEVNRIMDSIGDQS